MKAPDRFRNDVVPASFEREWRERFAEFAETHDDDAGIAGWSSSGLETRFRFFRRRWRAPSIGIEHLDVGCGAGTYARWLTEQGAQVVGIDYSHPTLVKARARTSVGIPLCVANAAQMPFRDASFHGAVCFGLLQAVPDSPPIARELARVLKPGGELWIDALNRWGLAARLDRARRRMSRRDMHLRYESPRHLENVLEEVGFDVVALHWLPMVPSRLSRLQPMLESKLAVALLGSVPGAGAIFSHSFVLHARRRGAQ
jgi:ubiquinone/menaquinone biosynthesis C-methylase UbiE